ncbi:hypothetical protein NPIL_268071 [Nephila pilipes]|uniref:Uncharacterized protein n=1 Tax=Nephila pilipes TaxID=299642 RepID=A0A8X6UPV9_NEPPI|nr:hypothetical protein NPIL_268071 [Nephila pilipes]
MSIVPHLIGSQGCRDLSYNQMTPYKALEKNKHVQFVQPKNIRFYPKDDVKQTSDGSGDCFGILYISREWFLYDGYNWGHWDL